MAEDWKYRYKNAKNKELLKEFEGWKDMDFISHITLLRDYIQELESKTDGDESKVAKNSQKQALNEKDYKQEWSYATKIHFLLHLQQKPLTSQDLDGLLLKFDKHYKDYDSPKNNLSVALGRAVKSGRIKKIKMPGIKNLYFALPEWMAENKLKDIFTIKTFYDQ